MTARLYFIHALSPIHCGTGHAISGIDLPIAREKPTGTPLVPGSSLKGVLRARADNADWVAAVFGHDTDKASEHAGSVQFSDAHLVFLPVRSVCGTFAWATCPSYLRRLARDTLEFGKQGVEPPAAPANERMVLVTGQTLVAGDKVVFEDFDFEWKHDDKLGKLASQVAEWVFSDDASRAFFTERVAVVSDDVMSVLQHTAMEIVARNRIDPDTGTVQKGALWTEEALPIESLLSGVLLATPVKPGKDKPAPEAKALLEHVAGLVKGQTLQVGGNATVGRGLCHVELV